MLSSHERTGVIIVRVWLEADAENALRARVTAVHDLKSRDVDDATASSVEGIVALVERFVRSFAEA
jgi:hypothetical protein